MTSLLDLQDKRAKLLEASGLKVGEPFPGIVLPTIDDGSAMSLADFRGQKVLLHIFASW